MLQEAEIQALYPWLNSALFNRILQKEFPSNVVHVQKYAVKVALGKGENFTSQMLRALVSYTVDASGDNHEFSFIIKAGHTDLSVRSVFAEMGVFDRETVCYEYVLPKVYELLAGADDNSRLSPK